MLEGPLLAAIAVAACFAGYEVIRRFGLLRPLFGLKRRTKAPVVARDVLRVTG